MEVLRHVVLRFLDGPIDILQGLAIHPDVQIYHCSVVVHIRILTAS